MRYGNLSGDEGGHCFEKAPVKNLLSIVVIIFPILQTLELVSSNVDDTSEDKILQDNLDVMSVGV